MLPDDVIVSSAFCRAALDAGALPPVVMMLAVELIVTAPVLLETKMPFASWR